MQGTGNTPFQIPRNSSLHLCRGVKYKRSVANECGCEKLPIGQVLLLRSLFFFSSFVLSHRVRKSGSEEEAPSNLFAANERTGTERRTKNLKDRNFISRELVDSWF